MNTITVENLSFIYRGSDKFAVRDVNLTIREGECVLLCGKSGCGKTTLTRFFNGLIPDYFEGEVTGKCRVFGLENGKNPIEDFVPVAGSVFQNPKTQYFNTNTMAELAFPCKNMGMPGEEIRQRIALCAQKYKLEELLDKSIFHLSGGEKQRIACGAATMLSPRLLVLDEPTSNLDNRAVGDLRDILEILKREGVTIVLAEHRIAWLKNLVDTCCFMENGRLTERYSAEEFWKLTDGELDRRGLRATNLEPYRKNLAEKEQRQTGGKPARLRMEQVEVGYQKKHPVYRVENLELYGGEIVGLMGENGIGKSTLTKTICGLLKPLKGQILWNGKRIAARELVRKCFLVMQDVNYELVSDSVREEVMLDTADSEACDKVLEKLGLTELAERHPMSLSGGQKQRVVIAAAMVSRKELILMDEPTSGLDRFHMQQVGQLLTELKKQGKTILVITHDEEMAADWCDRVYRMTGVGAPEDL